jgi:hypothetical protein
VSKKFQKKEEDFTCANCGFKVKGSGYTNHCPDCLFSRHVDNFPGDRENTCLGMMEPIDIEIKNGEYSIVHKCQKCQIVKKNKLNSKDNFSAALRIIEKKKKRLLYAR